MSGAYFLHIKKRTIAQNRKANGEHDISEQRLKINAITRLRRGEFAIFHLALLPIYRAALRTFMRRHLPEILLRMYPNNFLALLRASFAAMRMHRNRRMQCDAHTPRYPFDAAFVGFVGVAL